MMSRLLIFIFFLMCGFAISAQNKKTLSFAYDPKTMKGQNSLVYADADVNIFANVKSNKMVDFYGFNLKSKSKFSMDIDAMDESVNAKKMGRSVGGINSAVKTCVECPMELCPQSCTDPSGKTVNCWCQSGPCKPVICKGGLKKQ